MSTSSSSSADVNSYPSLPSPTSSMLNTGKTYDEDTLGRLLESAPFLVALLTESLQLRDLLEVRSLLFIFWGRSQGSALSRLSIDALVTPPGRWIRPASPRFLVASLHSQPSKSTPEIGSWSAESQIFVPAMETSTESSA